MKTWSATQILACSFLALAIPAMQLGAQNANSGAAAKAKLYNTTKQKLLDGKQVFSFTQSKMDIADYCERAKHYDFTWFEMQHSTLEFADIEKMIAACPHVKATPMIRLPDAQEWHIQHATDIGALGRCGSHRRRCGPGTGSSQMGPLSSRCAAQHGPGTGSQHLGHQRH